MIRLLLTLLLLHVPRLIVAQTNPASQETSRLAALARVWGHAKYFHPHLDGRAPIDWDSALIETIPLVRAARSTQEFRASIQFLLEKLGDPVTSVPLPGAPKVRGSSASGDLTYRWTRDSVLVIAAGSYFGLFGPDAQRKAGELAKLIPFARGVVFDLRATEAGGAFGMSALSGTIGPLLQLVSAEPLSAPGERRRVYYGYESQNQFASGQYRTGYFIQHAVSSRGSGGGRNIPAVFVLNEFAGLLPQMSSLQAAGRASIVYEGDVRAFEAGDIARLNLGEGLFAHIRQSEMLFADGTGGGFVPDVVLPFAGTARDVPLESALELATKTGGAMRRAAPIPSTVARTAERSYPLMLYPKTEYRLLAAFRLWNAIEHFFPYKSLLDEDWSSALSHAIPEFIAASDAKEYAIAVAHLAIRIHDSHSYVSSTVFNEQVLGDGFPPIRVRIVENAPLVTILFDSAAARQAGVELGDIVVAVDDEPAAARMERYARLLAASTPQSKRELASLSFMNGAVGSKVSLTLRGANGREKRVQLERRREDFNTLYHRERRTEIIRILPGNVGYADLDRLTYSMVDSMFATLADTRAIIFDMRGYPAGTVFAIAPRLTDSVRVAARIETPAVGHPLPESGATAMVNAFDQRFYPAAPGVARYRGPTFMLMDERSVSQAEHTGLWLRAANGTRFVGSSTAGADGEITTITLPGAITVGFTGQRVTFPDGSQVQRKGLTPDLAVRPTIAGIRAGRDEVLEAARLLALMGKQ